MEWYSTFCGFLIWTHCCQSSIFIYIIFIYFLFIYIFINIFRLLQRTSAEKNLKTFPLAQAIKKQHNKVKFWNWDPIISLKNHSTLQCTCLTQKSISWKTFSFLEQCAGSRAWNPGPRCPRWSSGSRTPCGKTPRRSWLHAIDERERGCAVASREREGLARVLLGGYWGGRCRVYSRPRLGQNRRENLRGMRYYLVFQPSTI